MYYSGIVDNALRSTVKRITVESAYGPPVVLDEPFASKEASPLVKALKPKITIHLRDASPVVVAPHGDPGESRWPWVQVAGLAVLGLAAYGLVALSRRRR